MPRSKAKKKQKRKRTPAQLHKLRLKNLKKARAVKKANARKASKRPKKSLQRQVVKGLRRPRFKPGKGRKTYQARFVPKTIGEAILGRELTPVKGLKTSGITTKDFSTVLYTIAKDAFTSFFGNDTKEL